MIATSDLSSYYISIYLVNAVNVGIVGTTNSRRDPDIPGDLR
jgi:hypothetical protein